MLVEIVREQLEHVFVDGLKKVKMQHVEEHAEGYPVELEKVGSRYIIKAKNEGGFNGTQVDLLQMLQWLETALNLNL